MVVCAPSGSGKTSICRAYMDRDDHARYSTSLTTRPPRAGEIHGEDYKFVTDEEFTDAIEGDELVEYEKVHDWMYGTPKKEIEDALANGERLLIDIDVKGGIAIKSRYPEDTLTIFIKPPSVEELKKRLRGRGSESEEKIERRLERYELELSKANEFDVIIKNDDFRTAVDKFSEAINAQGG
ncbi:MAG: guanylate kinase [Candidatus Marinimicrobia bacterium]|nr:guanylate kinase [Candidatus Neomarinimicrobiota bacterium]